MYITTWCFRHLLSSQVTSNPHSINEVMPVIGARFYSQLDSTQTRCDLLESELAKVMKIFFDNDSVETLASIIV